jgi:hypothetical protein
MIGSWFWKIWRKATRPVSVQRQVSLCEDPT